MALYESVFVVRQDIPQTAVETLTEDYKKVIEGFKGKVTKSEYWGLRQLAYRIQKNRRGHYTLLNLDCAPEGVAELERLMRMNEDVIRFLTVAVEELEEAPSAMMRPAEEQDSFGGDRFGRGGGDEGGQRRGGGFRGPRRDNSEGGSYDRRPRRSASGD